MIGGRNKYMINGTVAQQSRVQNLFHSVQLNVNNPHFLVRAPSKHMWATFIAPICVHTARRCLCRLCKVGSPRCST